MKHFFLFALSWIPALFGTVYDCFIFYNELDILEIRLHEMAPYIDKFVLVESVETFSGKSKPLYYEENRERFAQYNDKIIHIVTNQKVDAKSRWDREYFQRNAITRGLHEAAPNDIIFISDVDEIIRGEQIPHIISIMQQAEPHQVGRLEMANYSFHLNTKCVGENGEKWHAAAVTKYAHLCSEGSIHCLPQNVRTERNAFALFPNAGWHLGWMGGEDFARLKLESFSHAEYDLPQYKTKEMLLKGCNIHRWKFAAIDDTLPRYVLDNLEDFTKKGWVLSDEQIAFLVREGRIAAPGREMQKKATVCLNMVVHNEIENIEKCLESVKPLIDSWSIVDMGSTDGTQELITKAMQGIPGKLHKRQENDLQQMRNEALELARTQGDYLCCIDANEQLLFASDFFLPYLGEKDGYCFITQQQGLPDSLNRCLVNAKLPWRWQDNSLVCEQPVHFTILSGAVNVRNRPSRTIDPAKYAQDAECYEKALLEDPSNASYIYRLAQCYAITGNTELALKNYKLRSELINGNSQEIFFSLYCCGKILQQLGNFDEALKWMFKAHTLFPSYTEPLYHAAAIYRQLGNPLLGYLLTKHILSMPVSSGGPIDPAAYEVELLVEFSNCAFLTGRWEEGLKACNFLLEKPNLPEHLRAALLSNQEIARNRLGIN
ncbi:MAG: glycosyltransferase [Verrucomicrobiota bacterium]|nr:glycosyltransferase [Verrucomicrobiota bacterium]